jgi:hypothetical protein
MRQSYSKSSQMDQVESDGSSRVESVGSSRVESRICMHASVHCVGSLLYYARAVDPTMLPAINEISGSQASPTQKTMRACKMLLDYAATYPLAIIRYHASDMALHTDTDAAFLVLPNARSRYAGHYILSDTPPPLPAKPNPKPNGPILMVCKTIRGVVTSAAESETAGIYGNGQETIAVRIALHALGHPQSATPLKTDNSTSYSLVHANIKQRRSKTWDMRWNWLRDKQTHKQLRIWWDKGVNNDADYFTKHHPPSHHILMRPKYVLNAHQLTSQKQLLGGRVCSITDRYTAVTSNEHRKHQRLLAFTKLITQAISPHN